MNLYFIRHGRTRGNQEGRYVGRTDEPLTEEAKRALSEKESLCREALHPDILYVSPMLRCRETARILFPGKEQTIVEAFRECDFGAFEYKNYRELNGSPAYQEFIDSGGTSGFPGGETLREFQDRCVRGFCGAIAPAREGKAEGSMVFVVHGGTIMAVLERFSRPHRSYFEWQTGNAEGYAAGLVFDENTKEPLLVHIRELKM